MREYQVQSNGVITEFRPSGDDTTHNQKGYTGRMFDSELGGSSIVAVGRTTYLRKYFFLI